MKITLQPTQFIFTPSLNKIDFSNMLGTFKPERLLAVINVTQGKVMYATGSAAQGLGGTFSNTVYTNDTLTYASSNAGQLASDILEVLYDSEIEPQIVSGTITVNQPLDVSAADVPVRLSDANGVDILSSVDPITGEDGLNVNLLTSSFGGEIGSAMPLPFNNSALSVGVLNGGVLYSPAVDPVSSELQVQAKISDSAGQSIDLGQQVMADSVPVAIASDQVAVPVTFPSSTVLNVDVVQSVSQDILGVAIGGNRNNQIEVSFNVAPGASLITNTFTGSGAVSITNGHSVYSTGTTPVSSSRAVSVQETIYRPLHESYAAFTAGFLNPQSFCQSRIGLFDSQNGFAVGYDGVLFSIFVRNGGAESSVDQSSFNTDTLTGSSGSKFTRNGTPEAINLTLSNLFRIRFAWLGSANILFEVFSPDGEWVVFHNIRQPNTSFNPSIQDPNLPMTLELVKTGGATNSSIATACWGGGTTSALAPLNQSLAQSSLAVLSRSVITGESTGGGPTPSFVNVKVNPSGSLTVENTQSGTASQNIAQYGGAATSLGQKNSGNSVPVVIASDQSNVNTSAPDLYVTGAITNLLGNNLFNAVVGTGSTDASGYKTGAVQIVTAATSGNFTFEHSNDNVNFQVMAVFRADSASPNPIVTAITPVSSSFIYHFPIKARYIRLRISSALNNSCQAFLRLSQEAWSPIVPTTVQSTAANLNVTSTISGSVTVVQPTPTSLNVTAAVTGATLASAQTTDIGSAAITTTQTSANITMANIQACSFAVYVTAITGAGAAMDVQVQETMNGTDYYTIYTFERITATGQYYSPTIKLSGSGLRYIRTISGTTPSVTNSLNRIGRQGQAETVRRFINRTIDANTLNSNTGSFFCDGVEDFNLAVRCTAQTTAATIALEFSLDGTNWFTSSATLTTAVGVAHARIDNQQWKFVRAIVTAAGTGITLGDVTIGGHSA